MHQSVTRIWAAYRGVCTEPLGEIPPPAWHFCDNDIDADTCVALVLAGVKRATTPSVWFFESQGLALPAVGDLDIVTTWNGVAQCIIRTTVVHVMRFCDVTVEYARTEGEGDGSLDFWRAVHWDYYCRELAPSGLAPSVEMPVVCQQFEVVYPLASAPRV